VSQKSEEVYLVTFLSEEKEFVIIELKHPNPKLFKPIKLKAEETQISRSIEYDPTFSRIIYFSNERQEITVLSIKGKETICRVKVKHQRINPILYLCKFKNNVYLMVIGGYKVLGKSVEGCKYIEVFKIDKWEISLKQLIFRLGIGRINPIIFEN
jgi:hypothetical protein